MVDLTARYFLGRQNIVVDQLSFCYMIIPIEMLPFPQVFKETWRVYRRLVVDLFAIKRNQTLLVYRSQVPDLMT